jgi:hypothetical protein
MNSHTRFPALEAKHLSSPRLYADRRLMIEALSSPRKRVAEIGVALGEFSKALIDVFEPEKFVAFDVFEVHLQETLWGRATSEIFQGLTHADYYSANLRTYSPTKVVVEEGLSWERMATYPDKFFDLIYVDASHRYEDVVLDAAQSLRVIKDDGLLIFNDYIMYDHVLGEPYGVVPAVNELLASHPDWKVIGFALQKDLFCDIALARRS